MSMDEYVPESVTFSHLTGVLSCEKQHLILKHIKNLSLKVDG